MVFAARAAHARSLMLEVSAQKRRGSFRLDATFALPTPGVVALFGRSGCGKSTVVNIIAGLLTADSGRVALDDRTLFDSQGRVSVAPEHRSVGYVFQDARLFPHLRVEGNLRYAQRRARGAAYVSLDEVVSLLDLGPLLTRRTHQLSGGERQRVAIGRALLSQPALLLLDEPLAALDSARRQEVLPYLEILRDQLAIPMVYVTHSFEEVLRMATYIVLMEAGAVVAQGAVGAMSLDPHLRSIIGRDEVGAIVDGVVVGIDPVSQLTRVRVGHGELQVPTAGLHTGAALRVQLLARDIIISTRQPEFLSVRNSLMGTVERIENDDAGSDLVTLQVGTARILARITNAATRELALHPGMTAWALVKSISLRGHVLAAPTSIAYPGA
jgi:molybdate transport system ATP-binding protein